MINFFLGVIAGFATAVILYRLTAKPETLPCPCQDTTLPLRDPEAAARRVS